MIMQKIINDKNPFPNALINIQEYFPSFDKMIMEIALNYIKKETGNKTILFQELETYTAQYQNKLKSIPGRKEVQEQM